MMRKNIYWIGLVSSLVSATIGYAKYEQEQLALESQLQSRIESILAKTLPPNSYLVTVKVEMEDDTKASTVRTKTAGGGNNPFLQRNRFVLPGVPEKKEFSGSPEPSTNETVVNAFSSDTLVRRIQITILVAPDVTPEQIRAIRDVVSASIPFNPIRGDEMDIQTSPFLKPAGNQGAEGSKVSSSLYGSNRSGSGFWAGLKEGPNALLLILFGAVGMTFIIFVAFLFGPMRAFLNRLLQVLPRVGEQAAYAVSNAGTKTPVPGAALGGTVGGFNGNGSRGHDKEETQLPFYFIREDQLHKLPILFRQLTPEQAALVLAYLPPEWASRVLGLLEPHVQTAVMQQLSQAREVPSDIVKEVESQVKNRLPYLVGGVNWIESVYQFTQPQTQRTLLGTLNQQAPELAQSLRRKTFFYEDLVLLNPGAVRLIVQELGYPATALCLMEEKPESRNVILGRLPVAMREIVQQELDMSQEDRGAQADAKAKLVDIGRRLLAEGRIALPEKK